MRAAAFVYPWDITGDPAAADRLAATGVAQATLASSYHSTRALTPRHPHHRVVTARHAAVYYPPGEDRWAGRPLRPYPHGRDWAPGEDPWGEAAASLAAAGLDVHTWVICAHNTRLGEEHPEITVTNAFGDRYPWAPCIARPEVRTYVTTLAAEAAVRPGARGTELESCGWYGLEHLHAHDKTGGGHLSGTAAFLMSLCFCGSCQEGYAAHGADPDLLRRRVTGALAPHWAGAPAPRAASRAEERDGIRRALGEELADAVAAWRTAAAGRLQREAVAAVREEARRAGADGFRVMLHADPAPHRCGANVGVDPAGVLSHADGVVLPCPPGPDGEAGRAAVIEPFVPYRRSHSVLAANLTIVSGMGGSPGTLAADAAHAAGLGADELRLYHAGLANDDDLRQVTAALATLG